MRLFIKILIVIGIISFIAIQFFQPEKNLSQDVKNHIFSKEQLPENVKEIFKTSCVDCHSNNTNYLWYHKIAPVSWLVNKDVIKGKKELNLSEWGEMDNYDKIGAIEDIRQEVEQKTMPIKPYILMHPSAKLTDEEIAVLIAWIDKKGEELVKSQVEQ
jgi:mono/diheme cytochrome c family protein